MSEDTYKRIFSKNLKHYMEINRKTQTDIINDLGINKSAISTWCNGTRLPRMDKVDMLAKYLHCKRSDLIEEKEDSSYQSYYINEEYRNVFVRKLNYYMALNGKKQIDLINDLGLSSATVSSWCTGAKLPRMDKIQMLANYLGIEKSDLIEEKSRQKSIFTLKKDISEILSDTEALLNQKGLILDGELANEESIIYIISAMKIGLELAKTNNKKYISNE